MSPNNIRLIILTHGHIDHIGSAKDIRDITGAKIAMHKSDIEHVDESKWREKLPKGIGIWGKIVSGLMHMFAPFVKLKPFEVDLVVDDEGMLLTDFGIPGRIVHTPGHTAGSISVILDSGEAFIGCMAQNKASFYVIPLRLSPGLPVLADDIEKIKESWKLVLNPETKTIYPGHGKPFPAEKIRKILRAQIADYNHF
jgi:glyoxylase-like metal-dependent hydrolase (beta-lactamase superfamily II)